MSGFRLASGGRLIDRERPLRFSFDGRAMSGFAGDTVASALLANGVSVVARSFKLHRPRGILAAGVEEPNALLSLRRGARREPNVRATEQALYDGLVARSQNRWPSLGLDLMALNAPAAPFFAAGFYYKTFMGPTRKAWMFYEHLIRRAAGLGHAGLDPDPDRYEQAWAFADVLVVGSGPAGLAAATAAARAGASVILAEADPAFGGHLLDEDATLDGLAAADWAARQVADLGRAGVRLMPNTTVWGYYDGNVLAATERVADHLPEPPEHQPRQRLWTIRAKKAVLATGAFERPIAFPGNDRPGVMLAGAAGRFIARYGVAPGRTAMLFANNDLAYADAFRLHDAGVAVSAIVDPRERVAEGLREAADRRGIALHNGHVVTGTLGGGALRGVTIARFDVGRGVVGADETIATESLLVSGGFNPAIHLAQQAGGPPLFDDALQSFVPGEPREDWFAAGAINGVLTLPGALGDGHRAAGEALGGLGRSAGIAALPVVEGDTEPGPLLPLWEVRPKGRRAKSFVDFQNDVTADDVRLAHREGFRSVEHLKRYTTLGMATDQGKTSNVVGLALMAAESGVPPGEAGTTRFRPPYVPVTIGTLGGAEVGAELRPVRRTPLHDWHLRHGAVMLETGLWLRPRFYPIGDETLEQAYVREAAHVREAVGMADVSTLGKIDVQGPDAGTFLDRVYANGFAKLPVGKARYGLMLREDGIVFDDGTTWRLDEHRYLMTTTTANAAPVMQHLEFLLAAYWPELRVKLTSVTEQWAGMAVSGPRSRTVLERALEGIDFANAAFPFMGVREGRCQGLPVMVARLSFSGELAYEVYCGAHAGEAVWQAIMDAGSADGIIAYGIEAMGALRIEKGHVAGPELDGRTTLDDLGLGAMASARKWYVGRPLLDREGFTDAERLKLVGLRSRDGEPIHAGAHLVSGREAAQPGASQGHVTSMTYSPFLKTYIALALLEGGRGRLGETLYAADPLRGSHVAVEIVEPHFVDPEGTRMHG